MSKKKHLVAYVITKNANKSYWNRIGVGFVNRDGSINVKLDAIPVGGEFQLREYVSPDWERGGPPTASSRDVPAEPAGDSGAGGDDDIPF